MTWLRLAASSGFALATLVAVQSGLAAPRATGIGNVRMVFEANQGQADPGVRYVSRGPGYALLLRDTEAVLSLSHRQRSTQTVAFQWLGARAASVRAEQPTGGTSNYLTAAIHKTRIPHFGRVRYSGLYDGIDVLYYGADKQLEYDLIVQPGADPGQARFRVAGAREVSLRDGELHIDLQDREVRHRRPVVYQMIDGIRRSVEGEYVLLGRNDVGFRVGDYDKSHELVIDPVLAYSVVRGGSGNEEATSVALDGAGNVWVGGHTTSANLQLVSPLRSTFAGQSEGVVMKINPQGQVSYLTFFGGSGNEAVRGVAVDTTGNVYVAGETTSNNMFAAPARPYTAATDAFVAKLSPDGSQILYGTYLGGTDDDYAQGIDLSGANEAFVAGWTESTNLNDVTRTGNGAEAFICKVSATGTISATRYSGGAGSDRAYAVAVDGTGNVYIAGETSSTNVAGTALQPGNGGGIDGFIAKWDANLTSIYWAYLGGTGTDIIRGITTDSTGALYLTGSTMSTNFPRVSPIQNVLGGTMDAFVTKVNSLGTQIIYSTLLGGNLNDQGSAIVVDAAGSAFVAGFTDSNQNFPLVGSIKTTPPNFLQDVFVTQVNPAGSGWIYSTLLGGVASDVANALALDAAGGAYVAGTTFSPELTGAPTATQSDMFVMKIMNDCTLTLNPATVSFTAGPQRRTVQVQTGMDCTWTATPAGAGISIAGPASGTGPGTFTIAVEGNPGLPRAGTVTVGGQAVQVAQSGSISAGCTYGLSSNAANVPASGTNSRLTLTTTGGCAWEAYSNASWLQVFPLNGTGGATSFYTVYPNFTATARSAALVIGGQTFTVSQAANTLTPDERFVQLIYFSFFGRLPSASELAFQVTNGLGASKNYAGLTMNFLNSEEFNIGGRFVAGLYVGILDRNAEFGGWQFQRNAYSSGQIPPLTLVNNFLSSQEYTLRFGSPDNAEFVRLLYRYVLLREPTPDEVTFQVSQLQPQGPLTRAALASNFLNSPEFRQGTGPRLTAFLLYATLLLRDPSEAEMQARMQQLANANQATIQQIVGEIIQSGEFKAVVGWP